MAEERRGAGLVITKSDGQQITGELIAVKKNSLLLLGSKTAADTSVDIGDVLVIVIKKKPKPLLGAGIFAVAGGGLGALIGHNAYELDENNYRTLILMGIGAGVGAIIGMILGYAIAPDKIIQIADKSDAEMAKILQTLRSKARITNFQ
jgi:hypothetical protein